MLGSSSAAPLDDDTGPGGDNAETGGGVLADDDTGGPLGSPATTVGPHDDILESLESFGSRKKKKKVKKPVAAVEEEALGVEDQTTAADEELMDFDFTKKKKKKGAKGVLDELVGGGEDGGELAVSCVEFIFIFISHQKTISVCGGGLGCQLWRVSFQNQFCVCLLSLHAA